MWFTSWLRQRTVSPKRRPARRFQPALEVLEDRAVPATLLVNTNLDVLGHGNGMLSLRQAILDANARTTADTIMVPAGIYTLTRSAGESGFDMGLTGDLDISASTKNPLTISGAGAGTTVIDGGGLIRVFNVNYFGAVLIAGVTIQDGNAGLLSTGGGIASRYATLTVSNCTFSGNSAGAGGAIWTAGTLTVSNCTFSGNSAANPQTGAGGAISNVGTLMVSNCIFSDNSAVSNGGGLYNFGTATVSSSTFSGNSAISGGGIYIGGGTMTVNNGSLSGNSASQWGGGIVNYGKLTIRHSIVTGNTAPLGPDIVGKATLSDSTVGNMYYP